MELLTTFCGYTVGEIMKMKQRIAELEKDKAFLLTQRFMGNTIVSTGQGLSDAIKTHNLEQQRKGFWLGFEDARCHPDEMNILNQWENTKVFIESKGGAE
jgi:hypothetical protein